MKSYNIIYLALFLSILNVSVLGSFLYYHLNKDDGEYSTDTPQREKGYKIVMRELEMTPQQILQFENIRKKFRPDLDSLDLRMEMLSNYLLQEIWSSQPDSLRVSDIIKEISAIQTSSQYRVIRHFYQIKEFLTKDQWERFYSIVSKRYPAARGFPAPYHPPQMEMNQN